MKDDVCMKILNVSNTKRKLIINLLSMFAGRFASKALTFFLVPLYTTYLSTKEYGVCDLIFTSVSLLMPIFTLTIYEPMLRFSLDESENRSDILNNGIWITLIGFAVLMCFSPIILYFDSIKPYYWLCLLYYLGAAFYHCLSFFVRGIGKVFIFSISGVFYTFVIVISNLLCLVHFNMGIQGYLFSFIFSSYISCVFLFIAGELWKYGIFLSRPNFKLMKRMIRYSIPLTPNTISWWLNNSLDKYILTATYGVAVAGVYAVSHKIPIAIISLSYIVNAAWQLSSVDNFGSPESKKMYSNIHRTLFSTLVIGSAAIILLSKPLAIFLFKKEFFIAWKYVPALTISAIFISMCGFFETVYKAVKDTKALLYTTMFAAICKIILSYPLISYYGALGAAIATVFSYSVLYCVRIVGSRKLFQFDLGISKILLSFVLLGFESILVFLDGFYWDIMAFATLILIIIINRETFLDYVGLLKSIHLKRLFK